MPCSVTITDVVGIERPGDTPEVRITGVSEGCERIDLDVTCRDPRVGGTDRVSRLIEPNPDGTWETTFSEVSCARCGSWISVSARCLASDDECPADSWSGGLRCGDCPEVRVSTRVDDECRYPDDGPPTRRVRFTINVVAAPSVAVRTRVHFGDGEVSAWSTSRSYSQIHDYPASGAVTPRVEIDGECADVELDSIGLEPCPPPPPEEDDTPEFVCAGIESIRVSDPIETPGGCMLVWTVQLTIPGYPGEFEWRLEDGTVARTPDPILTRTYTSSGAKRVEVIFHPADPRCPEPRTALGTEIECEPRGGGGESKGCIIARTAMMVFLAASLAVLAYTACPSPPAPNLTTLLGIAGGFMLGFLVMLVLWLALCDNRPCKFGLLFFGQGLIGAGMVLLNLSRCCPAMAPLGAALITAGVALLIGWKFKCGVTWCAMVKELGFFTAGTLAVVLALVVVLGCVPDFSSEALAALLLVVFDTALSLAAAGAIVCPDRFGQVEPEREEITGLRDRLRDVEL